jgi:hypothetical protein
MAGGRVSARDTLVVRRALAEVVVVHLQLAPGTREGLVLLLRVAEVLRRWRWETVSVTVVGGFGA